MNPSPDTPRNPPAPARGPIWPFPPEVLDYSRKPLPPPERETPAARFSGLADIPAAPF